MAIKNYRPTPLDYAILELLPDRGVVSNVNWAGRPVRQVVEHLNERGADVTSATVNARMRTLKLAEYVEDFPAPGGGSIWARTPGGVTFLKTKAEVIG